MRMQDGWEKGDIVMKRLFLLVILVTLVCSPMAAQQTFGLKLGAYSTEIDIGSSALDTDRANTFGLFYEWRNPHLVVRASADFDQEADASFTAGATSKFSRDRFEVLVGYPGTTFMDLEGGIRIDSFDATSFTIPGGSTGRVGMDRQALVLGLHFHSQRDQRLAWYGIVRGYLGTMDISGVKDQDTSGYLVETGLPILFGNGWAVTPGVELERISTDQVAGDNTSLDFTTDRIFVSVSYTY